jgi:hypothetical protein
VTRFLSLVWGGRTANKDSVAWALDGRRARYRIFTTCLSEPATEPRPTTEDSYLRRTAVCPVFGLREFPLIVAKRAIRGAARSPRSMCRLRVVAVGTLSRPAGRMDVTRTYTLLMYDT